MLIELDIRNFAIMDAVNIKFGPGLNALTGETTVEDILENIFSTFCIGK
jgi:tRNA U34 5-carboxymethylaminomethyl modifying GTPase MnmE/TrmE